MERELYWVQGLVRPGQNAYRPRDQSSIVQRVAVGIASGSLRQMASARYRTP